MVSTPTVVFVNTQSGVIQWLARINGWMPVTCKFEPITAYRCFFEQDLISTSCRNSLSVHKVKQSYKKI